MKAARRAVSISLYILIVLLITSAVKAFVMQRTVVDGASMEPTLSSGDNLIVDKLTLKFSRPKRFDVVVFPFRYSKNVYYIKRVIALPGESVRIQDGQIYINGNLLNENYGLEPMLDGGRASFEITLGAGEYFVLGDNRNASMDSRSSDVGNVKISEITGRAWLRIRPISKFGVIK